MPFMSNCANARECVWAAGVWWRRSIKIVENRSRKLHQPQSNTVRVPDIDLWFYVVLALWLFLGRTSAQTDIIFPTWVLPHLGVELRLMHSDWKSEVLQHLVCLGRVIHFDRRRNIIQQDTIQPCGTLKYCKPRLSFVTERYKEKCFINVSLQNL